MLRSLALLLGVLLATGNAGAEEITQGSLSLSDIRAVATPPSARAGAVYMVISNAGDSADRLLEVRSSSYPDVQLHRTEIDGSVARMVHIQEVELPAGERVELAPGGTHVMFLGLKGKPFRAGEEVQAELVFEKAGTVKVSIPVVPISKAHGSGHGHSTEHDENGHGHDHHGHGDAGSGS